MKSSALTPERVSADIAALIGGTLLNQVALAVGQQAVLPPARRRHVAVLVDEFHALPAADYEAFLAELGKYGASLVLATQSLGMLDTIDADRGLKHTVFANVDRLYAFNCSAEDTRALAPELGGRIELADLVELGDHQCYARLSHQGERLPTFHLRLDPPPRPTPRSPRSWQPARPRSTGGPPRWWPRIGQPCSNGSMAR